jgi:hypothetical protein
MKAYQIQSTCDGMNWMTEYSRSRSAEAIKVAANLYREYRYQVSVRVLWAECEMSIWRNGDQSTETVVA